METDLLFTLTVTFALVAGTAASLLSLLTWEVFRKTPFGNAIFFLSFFMSLFILYHAVLIVLGASSPVVKTIESLVYTGFAVVVWLVAHTHRRMASSDGGVRAR